MTVIRLLMHQKHSAAGRTRLGELTGNVTAELRNACRSKQQYQEIRHLCTGRMNEFAIFHSRIKIWDITLILRLTEMRDSQQTWDGC